MPINLGGLVDVLKKIKPTNVEGAAPKLPDANPMKAIVPSSIYNPAPAAPAAIAEAVPSVGITPKAQIEAPNAGKFFNNGNPYANLKQEAGFREMYKDADVSGRQYGDAMTQGRFDKVYGEPMANGKSLRDITNPGWKGRLAQAGRSFVLGTAQGGLAQGLGAAIGGAADPSGAAEIGYNYGEGQEALARQDRQNAQQSAAMKLNEILSRISENRAQEQSAMGGLRIRQGEYERDTAMKNEDQQWKRRERENTASNWDTQADKLNIDTAKSKVELDRLIKESPLRTRKLEGDIRAQQLNQQRTALAVQLARETNPLKVEEARKRLAQIDQQIEASRANVAESYTNMDAKAEELKQRLIDEKGFSAEEAERYINSRRR